MVNNSIAIIPARGDSKRIPEKNIVDFNSKFDFVINYSIGTLQIPVAIINKSTKQFVVGIFLDTYKY